MSSQAVGKKRKRSALSSEVATALNIPDIPGVPMDVIPLFVHAIRTGTKFYSHCHDRVYFHDDDLDSTNDKHENNNSNSNNNKSDTQSFLLNSLLDRVQAATETVSPQEVELRQRKERMQEAIQQWLASIKRFVTKSSLKSANTTEETIENSRQPQTNKSPSVPYACFLYLWNLQQDHDRIAVRRSALYMTGLLLQRSRDCRFHLEQEDHLLQWMNRGLYLDRQYQQQQQSQQQQQQHSSTKSLEQRPLLQREAEYWLSYFVERGYSNILYPKLQVALQRLRQQCPHLATFSSTNNKKNHMDTFVTATMNDWRQWRDIALKYGAKERKHVQKWLDRAYECLDILVPRVGVATTTEPTPFQPNQANATSPLVSTTKDICNDDDDEDEDDIDWEDGDETLQQLGPAAVTQPDWDHFAAVERTLNAMESTGGLLGGEMEISLHKLKMDGKNNGNKVAEYDDYDDEYDVDYAPRSAASKEEHAKALTKFRKCISVLAQTHMPRLSIWMEGLRQADNLIMQENERSWVSMPSQVAMDRRKLLEQLTDLKQQVSNLLTTTSKLNDTEGQTREPHDRENSTLRPTQEDRLPLSLQLSKKNDHKGRRQRHQTLSAAVDRKRARKSGSSNRIQIKFRTT